MTVVLYVLAYLLVGLLLVLRFARGRDAGLRRFARDEAATAWALWPLVVVPLLVVGIGAAMQRVVAWAAPDDEGAGDA